jgi:hypothetical protein
MSGGPGKPECSDGGDDPTCPGACPGRPWGWPWVPLMIRSLDFLRVSVSPW